MKGQWGLEGIDLGAYPGPLGRQSNSVGESVVAKIGMRLRITRTQYCLEEKEDWECELEILPRQIREFELEARGKR